MADLSYLGKLELQAEPGIVSSIVAELTGGGACRTGEGKASRGGLVVSDHDGPRAGPEPA